MRKYIFMLAVLLIGYADNAMAGSQDTLAVNLISIFTANAIAVSNDTVAIVGNQGKIAGSSSNGNSFVFIQTPFPEDFLCVAKGRNKLWMGGRNGQMICVQDLSGLIPIATMTAEDIHDLFFANDLKGWIVGTNGLIKQTLDGGLNWTEQTSTVPTPLNGIAQVRGDTLITVGDFNPSLDGVILKTVDGGSLWQDLPSGIGKNLTSVCAMGDTIYVGGDSVIVKANDGGSTFWYELPYQFAGTVRSVDGFNPSDIWAGGDFGLCHSVDGGYTWEYMSFVSDTVKDVVCEGDFVYAVSSGKFYRLRVKENNPPTITSPDSVIGTVGELIQYSATVEDPDGDPIAFEFSGYPDWMIPAGSTISGTPTVAGTTSFSIIASDGEDTDTLVVTVTVNPIPNTPPKVTSPDSVLATENVQVIYIATGEDSDGDDLSFWFTGYPSWMAVNGDSIFGTPYIGAPDTNFSVFVTDGINQDSLTVFVTVQPAPVVNTAPSITSPDSASAEIGSGFEYVATGEDPEGDSLTFHFEDYPSWLNPNSAVLSCGEVPAEAADTSFVVIVSDGELGDTLTVRITITQPSAVESRQGNVPESFALFQNYPNPFNPSTTIRYALPKAVHVRLDVYDITGRLVTTLVDGRKGLGTYEVVFDATGLTSGMYFCSIRAGSFTAVRKMNVLK